MPGVNQATLALLSAEQGRGENKMENPSWVKIQDSLIKHKQRPHAERTKPKDLFFTSH